MKSLVQFEGLPSSTETKRFSKNDNQPYQDQFGSSVTQQLSSDSAWHTAKSWLVHRCKWCHILSISAPPTSVVTRVSFSAAKTVGNHSHICENVCFVPLGQVRWRQRTLWLRAAWPRSRPPAHPHMALCNRWWDGHQSRPRCTCSHGSGSPCVAHKHTEMVTVFLSIC